jgi:hypothetical protein
MQLILFFFASSKFPDELLIEIIMSIIFLPKPPSIIPLILMLSEALLTDTTKFFADIYRCDKI